MSNRLDPDQARHFVEPDLGPNCLQRLSANTSRNFFCCLLIFFQNNFYQKHYFKNIIRASNSLDPDLALHFVRPDLDPNCLQRLSTDDTSKKRFFCHLLIDFKINFFEKLFQKYHQSVKQLGSRSGLTF